MVGRRLWIRLNSRPISQQERFKELKVTIKRFFESHPFVKKHLIHFGVMFILLTGLIGTIIYYYTVCWSEETTTTYMTIAIERAKPTDDSFIRVTYVPGEEDRIRFCFRFENLSNDGICQFNIFHDGRMKEIETRTSRLAGVKERDHGDFLGQPIRRYEIDFRSERQPLFSETFSCNLFQDRTGEVRLHLQLQAPGSFPLTFRGLDSFNLEYVFPTPYEQLPDSIGYMYSAASSWDIQQSGVTIKGYNPYIQRKFREIQFWFGVAIAVLTSSLVALSIEVVRDVKTG